jgi:hypothetical protein
MMRRRPRFDERIAHLRIAVEISMEAASSQLLAARPVTRASGLKNRPYHDRQTARPTGPSHSSAC